ncbi:hypothetical protein M5K25_024367 [Dendrobium thyrsiflorum]|uniref:Uncharacterized protein n=1 Tax=Dendrobium thyrsiflorum TaxID=117978 RepID=A0ABD0U1U7_DENTH
MADPDVDHGFVFDEQGRTDVLRSPFFDVHFSHDDVTADDYLDQILYQLTRSIEEHIRPSQWVILGRRPLPPTSVTFPPTTVFGLLFLVVVSCLVRIAGISSKPEYQDSGEKQQLRLSIGRLSPGF